MKLKGIIFEDFVNYKKSCMTLEFPRCDFKCGCQLCQNSKLASAPDIEVEVKSIIEMYLNNPITSAICFQGLEPFDSASDVLEFVSEFRKQSNDDIVIYTGYYKEEIPDIINKLKVYNNIIIKFGRYIEGQEKRYDEVLGVHLASPNQYAERIEDINEI